MDLPAGISTLQRTDRWVGALLCAVLTLLRRIFKSAGQPGPRQVQRILFVKFAEELNRSCLSRNSSCDRHGWT
jgi:hypothetical protein